MKRINYLGSAGFDRSRHRRPYIGTGGLSTSGVRTKPGQITLARTPWAAPSLATTLARPIRPCLAVTYGAYGWTFRQCPLLPNIQTPSGGLLMSVLCRFCCRSHALQQSMPSLGQMPLQRLAVPFAKLGSGVIGFLQKAKQ
jgi:hypothetical protein